MSRRKKGHTDPPPAAVPVSSRPVESSSTRPAFSTRKNRSTPYGLQAQSSRDRHGSSGTSRSRESASSNWRSISAGEQWSRRHLRIMASIVTLLAWITISHTLSRLRWQRETTPRTRAATSAAAIVFFGNGPRLIPAPPYGPVLRPTALTAADALFPGY